MTAARAVYGATKTLWRLGKPTCAEASVGRWAQGGGISGEWAGKNSFPPTPFLFARPEEATYSSPAVALRALAGRQNRFAQNEQFPHHNSLWKKLRSRALRGKCFLLPERETSAVFVR